MTKKLLLAAAIAGCFAATAASAADVTLYGVADVGLRASRTEVDGVKTNKLEMMSGQNAGSRFGFKGAEDINGMKVGFQLEAQYMVDTGAFKNSLLFHRQATVYAQGQYGTLTFGRIGSFSSAAGTYDLFFGTGDSFDGGDGNVVGVFSYESRRDNMVTYASPDFAGFKVYAQYSFAQGTENAQSGLNQRYMGLAATYNQGPLNVALTAETVHYANANDAQDRQIDDKVVVGLAGNYNFGPVTVYAGAQYLKDGDNLANDWVSTSKFVTVDGYAAQIGAIAPALGGKFVVAAGYADGEANNLDGKLYDLTGYFGSVRYLYSFSKRTTVYASVGYQQLERDAAAGQTLSAAAEEKLYQAAVGITHKF
ncbi:porin [Sutterella sp.]|uniref:porin n=1 Tax=Sutterella sp. TaxID=1981025 RepID=UPI0026DF2808|nr:porin [Sutterella sp.]MDO5532489.1 porin [Sutterella sp.]